jgi:hypothetical protein
VVVDCVGAVVSTVVAVEVVLSVVAVPVGVAVVSVVVVAVEVVLLLQPASRITDDKANALIIADFIASIPSSNPDNSGCTSPPPVENPSNANFL